MSKINILTPDIYNKIAAGEVIEKPLGALKELVENSIDAGATQINIEVENGGFGLIKIVDNGCGIDEEDVTAAFLKHATSKIGTIDDLYVVQTLGFRGEALSSIAAVSRVTLTTRTHNQDTAVKAYVEDGIVQSQSYVPSNVGTTIEVRDLFYNTPARKKFFKSERAEAADISKFVSKLILTNPNLKIKYSLDGKITYESNGKGLEDAIYTVYGKNCLDNCIKISGSSDCMQIVGYIGTPEYAKPNRTHQILSVNGRCVTDQTVSAAVAQAYRAYLMSGRFPFYVLNMEIAPTLVDVNIHPKKSEVRFSNSGSVFSCVYRTVKDALLEFSRSKIDKEIFGGSQPADYEQDDKYEQEDKSHSDLSIEELLKLPVFANAERMNKHQNEDVKQIENTVDSLENREQFEEYKAYIGNTVSVKKDYEDMMRMKKQIWQQFASDAEKSTETEKVEVTPTIIREIPQRTEYDDAYDRTRILGVAFKTYLILELDDKVYFVDQHAAHERVLFDKFMEGKMQAMQPVLVPYVFTVKEDEALFIEENIENFKKAGIGIEPFGTNTFRIHEVSVLLADTEMKKFVEYMLSETDSFKPDDSKLIVEKLASMACHAAVKAGQSISEFEIKQIVKDIVQNKITQCPHGRPVIITFTKTQIEKMFKRIV